MRSGRGTFRVSRSHPSDAVPLLSKFFLMVRPIFLNSRESVMSEHSMFNSSRQRVCNRSSVASGSASCMCRNASRLSLLNLPRRSPPGFWAAVDPVASQRAIMR